MVPSDKESYLASIYANILEFTLYPNWRDDPNTKETPRRVAKSLLELTSGYTEDVEQYIKTFDTSEYNQIIAVKNIDYYSLCAHHMLPFFGKITVAYIPNGKVLGLSKFARISHAFARRLQIQEQLTEQICNFIHERLKPKATAVYITGTHLCMSMRGVECPNAVTETSALRGAFMDEAETRAELFKIIKS